MRSFRALLTALLLIFGAMAAPAAYASVGCEDMGAGWKLDGLFGPYTRRAVTQFQRAHHLQADGVAGPVTLKALQRPYRRTLKCGATGADVRALQEALAARGFWREGRAHAAARVAMAHAARRPAAAHRRPHVAIAPHVRRVAAVRHHRRAVTASHHRPAAVAVRPAAPEHQAVPIALAPRPRPAQGGWQQPVPYVNQSPPGHRPLSPRPRQSPQQFTRPLAEVVPIDVVTPPPAVPLVVEATPVPRPVPSLLPAPIPSTVEQLQEPPPRTRPNPPIAALPSPATSLPPTRAGPVEEPEATGAPSVEAHAGGWFAARGLDASTTVPILTGDATAWMGDWGVELAATNLDAPPTAALIYDLAAARRFGNCHVSVGYQGIGAGASHMAAVGAAIEQPLGPSWLEGHAGVRGATNLADFTADAHAGVGVKAGPAALEVGLRGLLLRSAGAGLSAPIDYEGPYLQLRIRI